MTSTRRAIEYGVYALVLLGIVWASADIAPKLLDGRLHVTYGWLAASAGAFAVGYIALAWGFDRLVRTVGAASPSRAASYELYFRSFLARYLPGKVGIPAVRMTSAPALEVSVAFMAVSVMLEGLAWLASGAFLAAAVLLGPWAPPKVRTLLDADAGFVLMALAALPALLLTGLPRTHYPSVVLRVLRVARSERPLLPLPLMLASIVVWLGTAAACACLAWSVGASSEVAARAAMGGIVAPFAAFFAIVVPAGLGVREAVFVLVLEGVLGAELALGIALLGRVVSLAVELALWLLCRVLLSRERARL